MSVNLASGSRDSTRDELWEVATQGSSRLMREVNDNEQIVVHNH